MDKSPKRTPKQKQKKIAVEVIADVNPKAEALKANAIGKGKKKNN